MSLASCDCLYNVRHGEQSKIPLTRFIPIVSAFLLSILSAWHVLSHKVRLPEPAALTVILPFFMQIATWSLEEKVDVTTGVGWTNGRCVGNIPSINDFPGLCLEDSPLGVRLADFATVFPAAINAAAT